MRRRMLSFVGIAIVAVAAWTMAGRAADKNTDWPAYSADKAATKYSSLDQIYKGNVKNLRIAWRRSAVPEELRAVYGDAQGGANYNHTPLVVDGLLYMSSSVGAVTALDPGTGKTVWFDQLPPGANGQARTRRIDAQHRLLDRRQGRPHHHERRRQPRRAQREDGQALHRLRRQRSGRSDQGLRAPHHRLALEQRSAGRQGRGDHRRRTVTGHRHPERESARAEGDAARRHPRLRRAHGQAPVDIPRRPAQGRVRQRDVAERLVDVLRQQRRLVPHQRGRGARATCTCRSRPRPATTTAGRGPGTTSLRRASSASTRRPASAYGTSRRSITDCGTTTCRPHQSSPTSPSTAGASRRSRRSRSRRSSSSSTGPTASPCGRLKSGPFPRATSPASGTHPRSRSRRSRRPSINRASPRRT